MGYYMSGGYYRSGGYYQGGFFSKVGKALGKLGGAASKLAPVASLVNPALGMGLGSLGGVASTMFGGSSKTASPGAGAKGLVGGASLPFLVGQMAVEQGIGVSPGGPVGVAFDIKNKLLGGGGAATAGAGLLPSHGAFTGRKRRTMNPLNPRALRRAYRRLTGAERWAHRLFSVSKPRHGVKPKFGRKRRS